MRLHRHHAPLTDAQHRGHCAARLHGNRDAVLVGSRAAKHRLTFADALDGAQAVAEARSQLVVAIVGGSVHLIAQLVVQRVRPALHELLHLLENLRIVRRIDLSFARSLSTV